MARPLLRRYEPWIDTGALWAYALGLVLLRGLRRIVPCSWRGVLVRPWSAWSTWAIQSPASHGTVHIESTPPRAAHTTPPVPGRFAWSLASPLNNTPSVRFQRKHTQGAHAERRADTEARGHGPPPDPTDAAPAAGDAMLVSCAHTPSSELLGGPVSDASHAAATGTHAFDTPRDAQKQTARDRDVAPDVVRSVPVPLPPPSSPPPLSPPPPSPPHGAVVERGEHDARPDTMPCGRPRDAPSWREELGFQADDLGTDSRPVAREAALQRTLSERAEHPTMHPAASVADQEGERGMPAPRARRYATRAHQARPPDAWLPASAVPRAVPAKRAADSAADAGPQRRTRTTHTTTVGRAKRVTTTVPTSPSSLPAAPRPRTRAAGPSSAPSQTSLLPRRSASGRHEPTERVVRRSTRVRAPRIHVDTPAAPRRVP